MKNHYSIIIAALTLLLSACNSSTDDFLNDISESYPAQTSSYPLTGIRWDYVSDESAGSSKSLSYCFFSNNMGAVLKSSAYASGEVAFFNYTFDGKTYKLDYVTPRPAGADAQLTLRNNGYLFDSYGSVLNKANISSSQLELFSKSCGSTGECTWCYDNVSTLYICGNGSMAEYGESQKSPWIYYGLAVKSVVVGDGVDNLGDYAFYGLKSLQDIQLPNTITSIGKYTFKDCSGLEATVPSAVKTIGIYAFCGCKSVAFSRYSLLSSIRSHSLSAENVTGLGYLESLVNIDNDAYIKCSSTLTLPSALKTIGSNAFYNNPTLEVTVPSSVTSIGEYAFYNCKKVTFKASSKLTRIQAHSLDAQDVVGIENLVNLESIDDNAYIKCSSSLSLPSSLKTIGIRAFYNNSALEVTIPSSVTSIGVRAFYGCAKVTFKASSKLTRIEAYSLDAEDVVGIENLVNLETIDDNANIKCNSNITLPNSLKTIGNYAFYGSFSKVTIGTNTVNIGKQAFATSKTYCYMYINRGIPPVLTSAIVDTPSKWALYVPQYCKNAYSTANYWKNMKSITEDSSLTPGGGLTFGENISFTVKGVTFRMIAVEGGTFKMGATSEQSNGYTPDSDEYPVHSVTLSDYYIGETEVTQALWQAVMGLSPSLDYSWSYTYGKGADYPAYYISYNECQDFITKLNQEIGLNFRMPTEAEWEYAARGGKKSNGYIFSGSNTIGTVAWYSSNSSSTHKVATKAPNELGIYDMSGNVYEWCSDCYGSYSSWSQTNPTGPSSGSDSLRVNRGGSWSGSAEDCRVSSRYFRTPTYRDNCLGLRLALPAVP